MRAAVLAPVVLCLVLVANVRSVSAENRVVVRGQYYREASTRVIQPVAEIVKDLPAGVDVTAYYLLDAITSASAASGPDGDTIFTENRSESGIGIGKSWSRLRLGGAYKYSAESDYWSHTFVLTAALRTWGDTGALVLSFGRGFDQVGRRVQGNAPSPAIAPGAPCAPSGARTCPLDSTFGGVGYSQVLSPTWLLQAGYEFNLLTGFLASPYRAVAGLGPEVVPDKRLRNAMTFRVAKYFPTTSTGLQGHYRYYWDLYPGEGPVASIVDPWQVSSHTVELRAFQEIGKELELRLTGRWYSQGAANFACDLGVAPGCYTGRQLFTSDPKLGAMVTKFLEAKLFWQAARWRGVPFVGWFSEGTFELSYGRSLQSTSFGPAHVLQTGYSLPF